MGSKGLWEPRTYMLEVGAGIFFLEPYDPDKIPVLFVHGIAGSPVEFRYLVQSLDRERYQPWLLAYPSALPITFLGSRLNDMLNLLHRRHDFGRLHVIAHSMGGLVSRAFINEYVHGGRHDYLGHFVTLSTPWGGADFARYYEEQPSPLELMGLRSRSNVRQDLAAGELPRPLVETLGTPPAGLKKPHIAWVDMNPRSEFLRKRAGAPAP